MRHFLLALGLSVMLLPAAFAEDLLREDHPDSYVVKEGDSLWRIASMFLTDAWMWPEIWEVNPDIDNPHLIYPGDEIYLRYVDGQPRLAVRRGEDGQMASSQAVRQGNRDEFLEPRTRVNPLISAIPAIPLDSVSSLLTDDRIVDRDTLDDAPHVLAGKAGDRLVLGPGDEFYGRGDWDEGSSSYGIYRKGATYRDPETRDVLGYEARFIGLARALERNDDLITFDLQRVVEEVRIGDRLLATEQQRVNSMFIPHPPTEEVDGVVMAVLGGLTQVGRNDVVVINRGTINGVDVGTVLAVNKSGAEVRDRVNRERVKLPPESAGIVMVFRVFDRMSYALVLETTQPLRKLDMVVNP